jgi:hypothetical protein
MSKEKDPLKDGSKLGLEDPPISEKRSKVIWQSRDRKAFCLINAVDEIWINCPFPLSVDELRDLEYALNKFLSL